MSDDHGHQHPKRYEFFVDNVKYESDIRKLTGAQIKARVQNWNPTFGLSLDGHGDEPDRLIDDNEVVDLETHHGPRRFFAVPPATFGAQQ